MKCKVKLWSKNETITFILYLWSVSKMLWLRLQVNMVAPPPCKRINLTYKKVIKKWKHISCISINPEFEMTHSNNNGLYTRSLQYWGISVDISQSKTQDWKLQVIDRPFGRGLRKKQNKECAGETIDGIDELLKSKCQIAPEAKRLGNQIYFHCV